MVVDFSPLFEAEIQTPTFSITSLIKFFKKVIIHATSNLMSSYWKFSRKNAFHHVLGARTQGCAFLMSSENLKTPCLLGGSKQMSAKHLGLHNISSPLFIEKKSLFRKHFIFWEHWMLSFLFLVFLAKYVFDYLKIISILNCIWLT